MKALWLSPTQHITNAFGTSTLRLLGIARERTTEVNLICDKSPLGPYATRLNPNYYQSPNKQW
jgi:hypothetical protein